MAVATQNFKKLYLRQLLR